MAKYLPEVLKYRLFLCTLPAFLRFKPYTADLFKGLTLMPVLIFTIASFYEVNGIILFNSPILHCVYYVNSGFHLTVALKRSAVHSTGNKNKCKIAGC